MTAPSADALERAKGISVGLDCCCTMKEEFYARYPKTRCLVCCIATVIDEARHSAAWEDFRFAFREIALQPDSKLTPEARKMKAEMRELVQPLIDNAVRDTRL